MKKEKRIVIKVGTSLITSSSGPFETLYLSEIVGDLCKVKEGREIILVSSGAIGAGMKVLGMADYPNILSVKQATAAVGQSRLMHIYEELFARYNQPIAQVLLTHRELRNRKERLNILNTFSTLFSFSVIPIVNENDAVATEELIFSDNDALASHLASLLAADLLILLTDENGLYKIDQDGNRYELIREVCEITKEMDGWVRDIEGKISRGGMKAKLSAVKLALDSGIKTVIASGKKKGIISEIIGGERVGTVFLPK
ncbi:glutamate 5-kinase [bacterium]|nr:glutamate 5-kinase [bacterium]